MQQPSKLRILTYKLYSSLVFPPAVVFIAILCVTAWTWQSARNSLHQDVKSDIDARILAIDTNIERRFGEYENILLGTSGFYTASEQVTDNEWQRYFASFKSENFQGLRSIGFARESTVAKLPSLTAEIAEKGITNSVIEPITSDQRIVIVQYSKLLSEKGTVTSGFNMASQANRLTAINQARDTGRAAMTDELKLIDDSNTPSVIIYEPVYKNGTAPKTIKERREQVIGYVYASLKANQFFGLIDSDRGGNSGAFRVSDKSGRANATLYTSPEFKTITERSSTTIHVQDLHIFNKTWQIEYAFDQDKLSTSSQRGAPFLVLITGFSLAILISYIVYSMLRARAHELSLEKEQGIALARDELLSLASHQLRTPATTVKQYLGMVLQGFSGDISKQQELLLDKAYQGNERQLYVINEMLHLARVDSGRIQLARRDIDVSNLVQEIVQEQKPDAEKQGHTLKLTLPKNPITIYADEHMLRMSIENILSNAIKYTPENGIIRVRLSRSTDKKKHLVIKISDTGVGIAEKDLSRLFKQFSRLPNERSDIVGGTGVGLYLAQHLVQLHGGNITVKSAIGKGTTFYITLPMRRIRVR